MLKETMMIDHTAILWRYADARARTEPVTRSGRRGLSLIGAITGRSAR